MRGNFAAIAVVVAAVSMVGSASRNASEAVAATRTGPVVVVLGKGFSQSFFSRTGGSEGSYGVLLANRSKTEDAFGVVVKVTPVGRTGGPIEDTTWTTKVTLIPAGTKFAVAEGVFLSGRARIAGLRVAVTAKETKRKARVLPPLSHLRFYNATHSITGVFTNPYRGTMSVWDVHYSYVVYDRRGAIVAGGNQPGDLLLSAKVIRPGSKAGFELAPTEGPDDASLARVSIDPGYLPRGGFPRR